MTTSTQSGRAGPSPKLYLPSLMGGFTALSKAMLAATTSSASPRPSPPLVPLPGGRWMDGGGAPAAGSKKLRSSAADCSTDAELSCEGVNGSLSHARWRADPWIFTSENAGSNNGTPMAFSRLTRKSSRQLLFSPFSQSSRRNSGTA